MLSCVLFLYFSIYITNCDVFVFSKFNTWLRVRGTAIRLAIAPEFFLLFLYSRILCLLWLAEIKYVYDDVYVKTDRHSSTAYTRDQSSRGKKWEVRIAYVFVASIACTSWNASYCYKRRNVARPVCLSRIPMNPANTHLHRPINMPFWLTDSRGLWDDILDGSAHWRHLANTIEWSVRRCRCGLSLPLL